MTRWTDADIPDLTGRTILVTGASSGLGLASAELIAARGALVLLACRNPAKAEQARARVAAVATGPAPELRALDLADLASVRACAAELVEDGRPLDVLLNNAGVMAVPLGRTVDGFELQLGTNHLGHFALTGLLLPALARAEGPRVVTVSSNAHKVGSIRLDDLNVERGDYRPWSAYGQSKLANLLFSAELGRRAAAAGAGLVALAAHPGYTATNLTSGPAGGNPVKRAVYSIGDRLVGQSARMGALPQVRAAVDPAAPPDAYYGPSWPGQWRGYPKLVDRSEAAKDTAVAARLWERSEALTGVEYDWLPFSSR